jgi:hypothetical protein
LALRAADLRLGKPISIESATPIAEIQTHPERYLGKEVRVEGQIAEVCQAMGCWMEVRDAAQHSIRVKVDDGVIEFPRDGAGRKVVAQGTVEKVTMTRDQYVALLRHEAEESGKKIDTSKITEGKTIYRLRGTGALVH